MVIKYKYQRGPAHTRVQVFIAMDVEFTFAKCGEIVLRNCEFDAWKIGRTEIIWEEAK